MTATERTTITMMRIPMISADDVATPITSLIHVSTGMSNKIHVYSYVDIMTEE